MLACRPANCGLFVVCDGHNGVAAAQYVADQLPAYLDDLLPLGEPPDEADAKAFLTWRQGLQRALTISLALLHRAFAGQGMLAGCTVTIVLQVRQSSDQDVLRSTLPDCTPCSSSSQQTFQSCSPACSSICVAAHSMAGCSRAPTWAIRGQSWTRAVR
jgi:serine/threonine protein phosphatase PrpC